MEVRIFLTNLAQYNSGDLVGKWVDLPLLEEDLEQEIKNVLGDDEEYFITDYEAPFRIEEYENLKELNEFAEEFSKLSEHDQHKVAYLIESIGYSNNDSLLHYEDVILYKNMRLEEVAEELVEEGIFGNIADNIKCYLDYERIAQDLSVDGYHETEQGTFCYH